MNTHNTREGEEWRNSHDFKQAVFAANQFLEEPYTDPDDDVRTVARQFNRMIDRYDALKQTHHQELQKARKMWLREEIVKLEGMRVTKKNAQEIAHTPLCRQNPEKGNNHFFCSITNADYFRNQALQTIIDRYQKELDQHK